MNDQWHFSSALNWFVDGRLFTPVNYPIPLNVFSSWYYEQRFDATIQKHVAKVFINNTLVAEIVNDGAKDFHNVKLYVSDPWHSSQGVFVIKDFKYGPL